MSDPSSSRLDNLNIGKLLLELLWQILILVAPIVTVALLPPWLGLLVVLFCASMMGIHAWLDMQRVALWFSHLMSTAVLGLGLSLAWTLPEFWNIAAAFASIFLGLLCVTTWEHKLGLAAEPPQREADQKAAFYEGSTDSSRNDEPRLTPEGKPIRVFNHGEIAMGGPSYCDYLFPDGVLLQGVGSRSRFSSDGRYFAAPVPSRQSWGLMILDRKLRRVYRCTNDMFWELEAFDETGLSGRCSPLVDNSSRKATLQDLLQSAQAVDLVQVSDIWIEPSLWQQSMAKKQIKYGGPHNRHILEGHLWVPDTLRHLPQPLEPLRRPLYRLSLDGEPTDLQFSVTSKPAWRPDGEALSILARKTGEESFSHWFWQSGTSWENLPSPWLASDKEPELSWSEPLTLDDHHLKIAASVDYPLLDHRHYGYSLQGTHSEVETQAGHDAQGRLQTVKRAPVSVQLIMPLDSNGKRGTSRIETAPLLNEQPAQLIWQHDNSEGLGGYLCEIGDWTLPGLWRLDHRVSDCQRYLALVTFNQLATSPSKVVVADVLERRLLEGPPMHVARLLDFIATKVSVADLQGSLSRTKVSTPLQRYDHSESSFGADHEDSRPYYQRRELEISADALNLLPVWRLVNRPQAASADGDFIQAAPDNSDAAWLFGCETGHADREPNKDAPRFGGCLLTASGCAIKHLAPPMIWSADARYLVLTRLHIEEQRSWQLLLLDTQERTLRLSPDTFDDRPHFESLDEEVLKVRLFEADEGSGTISGRGQLTEVRMSELLALPAETLVEQDGLFLADARQGDAQLWQALDKTALAAWLEA